MNTEIEAFWDRFEKECGERVLRKTMAQRFLSPSDRGDWGLLVLTDHSLRFRKTPGENWFASLFKAATPPPPPENPDLDLVIHRSDLVSVQAPPRKILDFLFGSPFAGFIVTYKSEGGIEKNVRFALDQRDGFREDIAAIIASQAD